MSGREGGGRREGGSREGAGGRRVRRVKGEEEDVYLTMQLHCIQSKRISHHS